MTTNPFLYGKPVEGDQFCDREEALERLLANLRSDNSLWLYAPRRLGKTSLIRRGLHALREERPSAFIDLYGVVDSESFVTRTLAGLAPLLARLAGGPRRLLELARAGLTTVSPQLSIDASGAPVLSLASRIGAGHLHTTVEQVLQLPERAAARAGRKVVLAFDEFQEVAAITGMEATMRSALQHQLHVSFVFAGSRHSLLRAMFVDRERPFFEFGEHLTLDRIPLDRLHSYVGARAAGTGVHWRDSEISDLVAASEGHPHYAQFFAAQAWELSRAGVRGQVLATAWRERVAQGMDPAFRHVFDGLPASQRRLVAHLAHHGGDGIFAQQTRDAYGLGGSSTVAAAAAALVERDVLDRVGDGRYRLQSPAMGIWVRAVVPTA